MKKLFLIGASALMCSTAAFAQTDSAVKVAPAAPAMTMTPAPAPTMAAESTVNPALEEKVSNLEGKVDGINESYLDTKSTVDKLKCLSVSGYIQAQFRAATKGWDAQKDTGNVYKNAYQYKVGDMAGGAFGNGIDKMFQIRRARLKVQYKASNGLSDGTLQLEILPFEVGNAVVSGTPTKVTKGTDTTKTPNVVTDTTYATYTSSPFFNKGGVSIKEADVHFCDPWLQSFGIRAGIIDRPYGFEIGYSSSSREAPEESRMTQTLFPNDQDLGAQIEYVPGSKVKSKGLQALNLRAGLFTGNGINIESDNRFDAIGRLGFKAPIYVANMEIDGGVSGYYGKVTSHNDTTYSFTKGVFVANYDTNYKFDRHRNDKSLLTRLYYGADLQIYKDIPVIGGISVRGEYNQGQQVCAGVSSSGSPSNNLPSTAAAYFRNFRGWYVNVVQNLDPLHSQLVFRYDSYNPNTDAKSADINGTKYYTDATKTKIDPTIVSAGTADLTYNTIGFGWVLHITPNVKLTAYYDHVMNEKATFAQTSTSRFYNTSLHDDVITARLQYKF